MALTEESKQYLQSDDKYKFFREVLKFGQKDLGEFLDKTTFNETQIQLLFATLEEVVETISDNTEPASRYRYYYLLARKSTSEEEYLDHLDRIQNTNIQNSLKALRDLLFNNTVNMGDRRYKCREFLMNNLGNYTEENDKEIEELVSVTVNYCQQCARNEYKGKDIDLAKDTVQLNQEEKLADPDIKWRNEGLSSLSFILSESLKIKELLKEMGTILGTSELVDRVDKVSIEARQIMKPLTEYYKKDFNSALTDYQEREKKAFGFEKKVYLLLIDYIKLSKKLYNPMFKDNKLYILITDINKYCKIRDLLMGDATLNFFSSSQKIEEAIQQLKGLPRYNFSRKVIELGVNGPKKIEALWKIKNDLLVILQELKNRRNDIETAFKKNSAYLNIYQRQSYSCYYLSLRSSYIGLRLMYGMEVTNGEDGLEISIQEEINRGKWIFQFQNDVTKQGLQFRDTEYPWVKTPTAAPVAQERNNSLVT